LEEINVEILIALHNIMRWVVVVLAILALVRVYRGWLGHKEWSDAVDRKVGVYFSTALDIQMLLGIILWFFGEWGYKAFQLVNSVGAGSRSTVLFFTLEHSIGMVAAVVLVHIGLSSTKRLTDSTAKFKRLAIFFSIAVLIILVSIPWTQRPLFPGI